MVTLYPFDGQYVLVGIQWLYQVYKTSMLQCTFASIAAQIVTSISKTDCLLKMSVDLTPLNTWVVLSTSPYSIKSHLLTRWVTVVTESFKRHNTNAFYFYQERTSVQITSEQLQDKSGVINLRRNRLCTTSVLGVAMKSLRVGPLWMPC